MAERVNQYHIDSCINPVVTGVLWITLPFFIIKYRVFHFFQEEYSHYNSEKANDDDDHILFFQLLLVLFPTESYRFKVLCKHLIRDDEEDRSNESINGQKYIV